MNYEKIYNQIVTYRQESCPVGYKEKHHILPKCMNGSNSKDNLVYLTSREHYVCHKLLTKFVADQFKQKMIYAWHMMMTVDKGNRKLHISSHDYQILKIKISAERLGKSLSAETKEKMSIKAQGKNNPFYGKRHTKETKDKISTFQLNKEVSLETRKKMSQSRLGCRYSDETIKKMCKAQSGKNHPLYGKNHSLETKLKMSLAHTGENNPMFGNHCFEAISPIGEKFIVRGVSIFAKKYNLNAGAIGKCIAKRHKSHKGWTFEKL
jgi:hypothetical protein